MEKKRTVVAIYWQMLYNSLMRSRLDILLVAGLTTMMGGVVMSFSLISAQAALREEVIAAVTQTGEEINDIIAEKVKAAENIEATATTLILTMSDPAVNPTIIELEEGRIRLTEGEKISYLTTTATEVANLRFLLLGKAEERSEGGIDVSFAVIGKTEGETAPPLKYTKEFETTISGE